ncbi:MAG TPA: hypothetical protein EYH30_05350 [Anaerolineales bacterium]|nr:hypothetical protein [Anaerolineales bacterium]
MESRSRPGRPRWLPPLLLLAVTLPLYLAFRSISLDDFDAYSFALALEHFNLDLQQPQPPGFPVYVFLGRILLPLAGGPRAALTLLSGLSGAAIALVVYGLGRAADPRRSLTGVGGALLVALSPMGWLAAEKALSDAPGLALTLLALWLLWRGRGDLGRLGLGSLVAGLSLGLRPQNGLPVLLLLVGLTIRHLARRRSLLPLAWGALPFLLGALAWLVPTLQAVGGLPAYLAHLAAHSAHVRQADSLLATGLPLPAALRARALAFADTLLLHTVGVDLSGGWGWAEGIRGLALALVVVPGLVRAGWRRWETGLLAVWLALAAGQVFLLETLDRPRLMLPLLPPLALLVARGWARMRRPRFLAPAALVGAAFALLTQGVPLAAQLASVPAPPAQAAAYIAAHYPPGETVVAAAGSFRAAQVELPAYRLLYLYTFDPAAARVATEAIPYIAVLDRDQFPEEAMAVLSDDGRYVPLEDRTFGRDPRVHTQHDRVRLQVLTPADRLPPQALALPPGGCVDVGGPEDGRYLDRGWYRPEEIGGVGGRWAGSGLTATVRLYLEPGRVYRIRLRALAYPAGQQVAVRINRWEVARLSLAQEWAEYTVSLPASHVSPGEVTLVELVHARQATPFAETGGASSDRRPLTAAYDWICVAVDSQP